MLKMDSTIEPNTRLYNSLMLAYSGCGDSSKALSYWDDITLSSEGPSYRSLEIVFLACRGKAFGEKKARSIWDKMRRMDIEITPQVFVAYLGALAGNSQLDEAKGLIESAEKDAGLKPNVKM
jgi:ubiquitin-like modifier-activating enzyme ATG7